MRKSIRVSIPRSNGLYRGLALSATILFFCSWSYGGLINIGSQRQLFVDDFLIERLDHVSKRLNPAIKVVDNPVIPRDKPWEGSDTRINWVIFDEVLKKFRMRYTTGDWVPVHNGENSGDEGARKPRQLDAKFINGHTCEAFSSDGVHWDKPSLGLVEFSGSKANNLLPEESSRIQYFFQDMHDPDPSKRYKGLIRYGSVTEPNMKFDLYYSADAYHWTPYEGNPVINLGRHVGRWGPTLFTGWDPVRKTYAAHMEYSLHMDGDTRVAIGYDHLRKRSQGRAESPDMIHWNEPELIMSPDDRDYPDIEFYALPVSSYEGYYIGLLWNFSTTDTLFHPEFVFSRDGIRYNRDNRKPFIYRGDNGDFDSVCVYTNSPIFHDGQVYIYYTGVNWRSPEHLKMLGDKSRGSVGLAVLRQDGFVSLDSGRTDPGVVTTRPFSFSGDNLYLNIKRAFLEWGAGKPEMKVEILDSRFEPIEGFTIKDSETISESGLDQQVEWKNVPNLSKVKGRTIALRFHFNNMKLYSFQFR